MDDTHGPNWPDKGLDEPGESGVSTHHIDVRRAMMIGFLLALLVAWMVLLRVVH